MSNADTNKSQRDHLCERLEPDVDLCIRFDTPLADVAAVSQAISLKRIADALGKLAASGYVVHTEGMSNGTD